MYIGVYICGVLYTYSFPSSLWIVFRQHVQKTTQLQWQETIMSSRSPLQKKVGNPMGFTIRFQDLILLFHHFAHPTERGGRLSCNELVQLLRAVGSGEAAPELPEGFPERIYEALAPQGVPLKLGPRWGGFHEW